MALKPSYNDKLHLPGLSKTEILILALEASQKLEWNIEEVTTEGARFEVPFNMYSHGEEITFTIEPGNDGEVAVRSQSSSVQFVDYGKNRKNIQKLRETMEEIKIWKKKRKGTLSGRSLFLAKVLWQRLS